MLETTMDAPNAPMVGNLQVISPKTESVVGLEQGATWEMTHDGGQTWQVMTGTSFLLEDGIYTNESGIRQIDAAGNTGDPSFNDQPFAVASVFGTSSADTLTLSTGGNLVYTGAGADVIKITAATGASATTPNHVLDFSAEDSIDLSALLGTGGAGYTGSVIADTGAGFVEISDLSLVKNTTNNTTVVQFNIHFDAASIDGSKITGAVIDLGYAYASVSAAQVTSSKYDLVDAFGGTTPTNVWKLVESNMAGASANGKIALVADTDATNPIIDADKNVLTVKLLVTGLVDTFEVGLEAKSDGGDTVVTTADNVTHNIEVGITKVAGQVSGSNGILEAAYDETALGTVTDNQIRLFSEYNQESDTTTGYFQYDKDSSFGTTDFSDVLALVFEGDVTDTLTPANLNLI